MRRVDGKSLDIDHYAPRAAEMRAQRLLIVEQVSVFLREKLEEDDWGEFGPRLDALREKLLRGLSLRELEDDLRELLNFGRKGEITCGGIIAYWEEKRAEIQASFAELRAFFRGEKTIEQIKNECARNVALAFSDDLPEGVEKADEENELAKDLPAGDPAFRRQLEYYRELDGKGGKGSRTAVFAFFGDVPIGRMISSDELKKLLRDDSAKAVEHFLDNEEGRKTQPSSLFNTGNPYYLQRQGSFRSYYLKKAEKKP